MIDQATVDAYGDSEQTTGWLTMIEENLAVPFDTTVLAQRCRQPPIDDWKRLLSAPANRDNLLAAIEQKIRVAAVRCSIPSLALVSIRHEHSLGGSQVRIKPRQSFLDELGGRDQVSWRVDEHLLLSLGSSQ